VTAFWYNPNIHPFTEHRHRLESMRTLAEAIDLPLLVADGYDMLDYFRAVVGHEGERCGECFRMRLDRTATVASENGFALFTTTLLISPYQKHELLRRTGEAVARERGIEFPSEPASETASVSHGSWTCIIRSTAAASTASGSASVRLTSPRCWRTHSLFREGRSALALVQLP